MIGQTVSCTSIGPLVLAKPSKSKKHMQTTFFNAVENGDAQTVERLLDSYPEFLNLKAVNNWTAVMFAIRYGHFDLVKLLFERGASM
jgi:ankyrin repeat protein